MKGDDKKFLSALAAALILAGVVVYRGHLASLELEPGRGADVALIEKLAAEGVLSLKPADYASPVEDPGR